MTSNEMKEILTQERLIEKIYYNPETGVFNRKFKFLKKDRVNASAGSINSAGYRIIGIDYKTYYAHRLAWLYIYGYFPEYKIDHKNRKRSDNRLENLREATQQCNLRNSNIKRNNTSGVTGVAFDKDLCKWKANITVNYKTKHISVNSDFGSAVKNRWLAEIKYCFPNCNTTSSAYKYLKKHNLLNRS